MKNNLRLATLLLIIFGTKIYTFAQANWQWVTKLTDGVVSITHDRMTVDNNGYTYVTGHFVPGPGHTFVLGTDSLRAYGDFDIFITKIDPSGNVVWARSGGGSYVETGNDITTDKYGNIYVVGQFASDSITIGNYTLKNCNQGSTNFDMFIVKYDANGNLLWAKNAGGNSGDVATVVRVDDNGNAYVAGTFASYPFNISTFSLTHNDSGKGFIAKYNSSGDVIWAKSTGGKSLLSGAVFNNQSIYIAGSLDYACKFDTFNVANIGTGGDDAIIIKYDTSGKVLWVKSGGDNDATIAKGVTVDASGNAYITGGFYSQTARFGTFTLTGNGGNYDVFIVKYDVNGNEVWARNSLGNDFDTGESITIDKNSNLLVLGSFKTPTIKFDTVTLANTNPLPNNAKFDIFVVQYDLLGNLIWAKSFGGSKDDFGVNIGCDKDNSFYILGEAASPSIVLATITTNDPGVFVTKFGDAGNNPNSLAAPTNLTAAPGKTESSTVMLTWTDNATNETGFKIERSNDGNSFYLIDMVAANVQSYLDENTDPSTSYYYRVYAYNTQATSAFSNVVQITTGTPSSIHNVTSKASVLIYPNPAKNTVQLENLPKNILLNITDASGRNMYSTKPNSNAVNINLTEFSNGIYFVQIESNNNIFYKKFIVVK